MKFKKEDTIDERVWMGRLLYNEGLRALDLVYSGGGDSGDLDEICYYGENHVEIDLDKIEKQLESIKLPFRSAAFGTVDALSFLKGITSDDAMEAGNWWDNDGGQATSSYSVMKEGLVMQYVDVTYYEPDDFDDDYDDDDCDYDEIPEATP